VPLLRCAALNPRSPHLTVCRGGSRTCIVAFSVSAHARTRCGSMSARFFRPYFSVPLIPPRVVTMAWPHVARELKAFFHTHGYYRLLTHYAHRSDIAV
jgi:hypothetical protein